MKCACGENDARYINERGELCCGLCPIKQGLDSIKISDVGMLLVIARALTVQTDSRAIERCIEHLRIRLGNAP